MRALAWVTDLHLMADEKIELDIEGADGLISTGDLCDGLGFTGRLRELQEKTALPLYFVLGNHERYGTTISAAVESAMEIDGEGDICYLTAHDPVLLDEHTALIGHDAWADGRDGDFLDSPIEVRDFDHIVDFSGRNRWERYERVKQLGDEAALALEPKLISALGQRDSVLLAMHPAPFREAAQYEGRMADLHIAPHFVCHAVGEMLLRVMKHYPAKQLTVLCGHAHSRCEVVMRPNIVVKAGWRLAPQLIRTNLPSPV